MSSLRSQLHEDADALLMMHAAGELPPEDEQHVQAMLAADGELRARFAAICADLDLVDQRFSSLDVWNGLKAEPAMRQAVATIRNWHLGRKAVPAVEAPPTLEPRRWSMPSAAAALLAVGFGVAAVATYFSSDGPRPVSQVDTLPDGTDESIDNSLALHAAASLAVGPELDEDAPPAAPMPPTSTEPLANWDRPFFEVPLIADADSD